MLTPYRKKRTTFPFCDAGTWSLKDLKGHFRAEVERCPDESGVAHRPMLVIGFCPARRWTHAFAIRDDVGRRLGGRDGGIFVFILAWHGKHLQLHIRDGSQVHAICIELYT